MPLIEKSRTNPNGFASSALGARISLVADKRIPLNLEN
jgi:hypothetical protein